MSKAFLNNTVLELCTSIQEGLPMVPTSYMRVLVEGILGAASEKYPVTICAYVVMRNHLHMLVVVQNPRDVCEFMRYLKTELAHAINSLLGRKNRSVWIPDYDNPVLLDAAKTLERLEYLYLNPARANLCRSLEQYPGLSSFDAAKADTAQKTFKKRVKKVSRDAIPTLPLRVLSIKEQDKLAAELREGRGTEYTLSVSPWAWLACFPETKEADPSFQQSMFFSRFEKAERNVVAGHKASPPTAQQLRMKDPRENYVSKRDGKKMICMSSDVDLRCAFIDWFKEQARLAKAAIKKWCQGDLESKPPPGFFLPGGTLLASALFPVLL